ncbi:hypothetical protein N184_27385 [Sinorhizobium sp. GL28]|nr:hypothetical protein N184_27385 [Sinorhizobium sp. GL28]
MHRVQRVEEAWLGRCPKLDRALLRRQQEERQQLGHRWTGLVSFCKALALARMRGSFIDIFTLLAQLHLIFYITIDIYNKDRCQLESI